jgi:hydrogenase-4 component B
MTILLFMITAYAAGALLAPICSNSVFRRLGPIAAASGAAAGIAAAISVLTARSEYSLAIPGVFPFMALHFRLDPLGALFLLLIGIVGVPAAIYGIGYARHGSQRLSGCMLNLFFLSMSLVVMASSVLTFLVFWEAMSLASYFLVISENQDAENLSAGLWYAGMAHAGFGLVAIGLLAASSNTPGMLFEEIRSAAIDPAKRDLIFVLCLIGFGSKAGLIPLHVWLPKAHPAAPSHISAMMSGVMVKLGIYGIIRVSLDLLGGGPSWWGMLVLAVGAVSAVIGVLYALMEHDLKRLLAYHTVENVGLIAMGVGLALTFRSFGFAAISALALVAGLFHTINHGVFKGLLFLGAGSVLHATGTRNMEEMGGLIKKMPVTSACFLIGAAAISGLPPLNGFASEWMLFQALLAGARIPHAFASAMMAAGVGMLALTAGLAATCFVKAFGISFLALPRSHEAEVAGEVPSTMRWPMIFLSSLCVLLGVLACWAAPFIALALRGIPGVDPSSVAFRAGMLMDAPGLSSRISPTYTAMLMLLLVCLIPVFFRLFRVNPSLRFGDSWGCGRIGQSSRMEYTSTAFAEPLRRVFSALYRPTKDITVEHHPESRYLVRSIQYRTEVSTWFEEYLYDPLIHALMRFGTVGRWIQSGSVHWYVGYIFIGLLLFLLMARWL